MSENHHENALEQELTYHKKWINESSGGGRSEDQWLEINRALFTALNESESAHEKIVKQGFSAYSGSSKDSWKERFENEWLLPYKKKNVMDIGCGSRIRCQVFTKSYIYCVDPLLDKYAEFNNDCFNFQHMEKLISAPAEKKQPELIKTQDLVFCWNMLDHVESWQEVISNISSYLKKNGLVRLRNNKKLSL